MQQQFSILNDMSPTSFYNTSTPPSASQSPTTPHSRDSLNLNGVSNTANNNSSNGMITTGRNSLKNRFSTFFQRKSAKRPIPIFTASFSPSQLKPFEKLRIEEYDALFLQSIQDANVDAFVLYTEAILHYKLATYETLIQRIEKQIRDGHEATLLHLAASKNACVPILKYMIQHLNIDLCLENRFQSTVFHYAASNNAIECIMYLLELLPFYLPNKSAQVQFKEKRDFYGYTALHRAVISQHYETVQLLLEIGQWNVESNVRNVCAGARPIHLAADTMDFKMLKLLIEKGKCNTNASLLQHLF